MTEKSSLRYWPSEDHKRAAELLRLIGRKGRIRFGEDPLPSEDELFADLGALVAAAIRHHDVGVLDLVSWELHREAVIADCEPETRSPDHAARCRGLMAVAKPAYEAEVEARRRMAESGETQPLMSEGELDRVRQLAATFDELPEWFSGTLAKSLADSVEPLLAHVSQLQRLLGVKLENRR